MRLSRQEVDAIKAAAREAFGDGVVVRLFGSRVHDHLRGGDIDLHVLAGATAATVDHEVVFRRELWKRLDEPNVDVVVAGHGRDPRWIDRAAMRDGVVL